MASIYQSDNNKSGDESESSESEISDNISLYSNNTKYISSVHKNANIITSEIKMIDKFISNTKIKNIIEYSQYKINPLINPMLGNSKYRTIYGGEGFLPASSFIYPLETVMYKASKRYKLKHSPNLQFLKGGPRKQIVFNPNITRVAIVTCGGLCPGLNVVIREIVNSLNFNYGVRQVFGIKFGFKGFYTYDWVELTPAYVKDIHKLGGTILGTSRGGFDKDKIIEKLDENQINILFVIGGDGTHRGAIELFKEIEAKQMPVSIACIPKTIDNDIPYIDRSFGFLTSVEQALHAIESGETEASCAEYGIGLIKLMGRNAGHIALHASFSHRSVNICLVPEFDYELYGKNGLLNYIYKRLKVKKKCIIVVAEGCCHSFKDREMECLGKDPSGNPKFGDVGVMLKDEITKFCKEKNLDVTLKYIDPTYMIRSVPASSFDKEICAQLAQSVVHGCMAGYSGYSVGFVNNITCYLPLDLITKKANLIKPKERSWQRLMASTGQPTFLNNIE